MCVPKGALRTHSSTMGQPSYLCSVLFVRALVLGLSLKELDSGVEILCIASHPV